MTLDEEIYKQEEKAMTYRSMGNELSLCYSQEQQQRALEDYHMSAYHSQLAEWLRELKFYKDRQDLINKSWQELINYKEGIEKIKMRSQAYRECGESILASGMEQALDILEEVNADADSN